jgi:hypothetical protein
MKYQRAIQLAQDYAASCGIPWKDVRVVNKERSWWYFNVHSYELDVDTGDGTARILVSNHFWNVRGIYSFEYYPNDETGDLLPLWLAFPGFTSVAIGWRMGRGEVYKYRWHDWYRRLSEARRTEYKRKYSPPEDDDRAWQGFYEFIADVPSGGSISDQIFGRI